MNRTLPGAYGDLSHGSSGWPMRAGRGCAAGGLCSHHPELIDYLGGDRGLVLSWQSSGATVVRPASELAVEGGLKLSEVIARVGIMSRNVNVVILCEDRQHEAFARRFRTDGQGSAGSAGRNQSERARFREQFV